MHLNVAYKGVKTVTTVNFVIQGPFFSVARVSYKHIKNPCISVGGYTYMGLSVAHVPRACHFLFLKRH